MKRTVLLILTLLLISLTVFSGFATTKVSYSSLKNDKHYFFSDNSNAYYISVSGKKAIINTLGKEYTSIIFDNNIRYCHLVEGKLYFLLKTSDSFTKIAVYNISTKKYSCKNYGDFEVIRDFYSTVDIDGNIYLVDKSKNRLYIYSQQGDVVKKFKFTDCINQVTTYDGKCVYVLTDYKNYVINNLQITQLGDSYVDYPIRFLSSRYAVSENKIYDLSHNCNVIKNCDESTTAVYSKGFVYGEGNDVYYSPIDTDEITKHATLKENIVELYGDSNRIYAFTNSNVYLLTSNDFKKVESSTTVTSTESEVNDENTADNSSSIYNITPSYITNINAYTTVSVFKNGLKGNGYEASVVNNGTEKTSGYVGTGMIVKLTDGTNTKSYTAIVDGDITGEGSINTKDVKLLMDYLLSTKDLSPCCRLSANVIDDGKISNADLVKISQMKK